MTFAQLTKFKNYGIIIPEDKGKGDKNMKLLLTFVILSILNVVFSTIKSLITVKGSPVCASLVSAFYYGYYNVVLVYTVSDFPLWQKVIVTFACNLVGVYLVKWAEAKTRKDRLWEIRGTIKDDVDAAMCIEMLTTSDIPFNYIDVTKYVIFNCYSATQEDSLKIKDIFERCNAKYFATEGKEL